MYTITANFQNYWHIDTGRGSGQNLDSLVEKDQNKLPYISGKTIKGLFRDAVYKLDAWTGEQHVESLFGVRTDDANQGREKTYAGVLRFNNLELLNEEQAYLIANPILKSHFYKTHASTSIDFETGVAEDKSLRMSEVVIPLSLLGKITLLSGSGKCSLSEPEIYALLQEAATMITHIGANKNRGFGRVKLEVKR